GHHAARLQAQFAQHCPCMRSTARQEYRGDVGIVTATAAAPKAPSDRRTKCAAFAVQTPTASFAAEVGNRSANLRGSKTNAAIAASTNPFAIRGRSFPIRAEPVRQSRLDSQCRARIHDEGDHALPDPRACCLWDLH